MKPFLKWAGGKRQLLNKILQTIKTCQDTQGEEKDQFTFYEPFVGGGAIFLALENKKTVINDINSELVNCYLMVKQQPEGLMEKLNELKAGFLQDTTPAHKFFYDIRKKDRDSNFATAEPIEKAARTIFLNKTCYNGLYRVNSNGFFNTPIGTGDKNVNLYNKNNLLAISRFLNQKDVQIYNKDYREVLSNVSRGDIVYLDPPYDYDGADGFTGYQKDGFSFEDFQALKKEADRCLSVGASVIISNNNTKRVADLFVEDPAYSIYFVDQMATKRYINCKGQLRETGSEIIVWGTTYHECPQANNINSVIKLISIRNPDDLQSARKILETIGLQTERQAAYYLAALRCIKITDEKKHFTKLGATLREEKPDQLKADLAKAILSLPPFLEYYKSRVNGNRALTDEELARKIVNWEAGHINEKTAKRRVSTLKNWVNFCVDALDAQMP